TDNLSSEIEYTHKVVNSPSTLETGPFTEFQVQLPSSTFVYAGPDISRQANNLGNTDQQIRARVNYTLGDHVLSAGIEHEQLEEFDLFVQYATGLYVFSNACGSFNGVTNLQNHQAC